jgi:hypothetical protein
MGNEHNYDNDHSLVYEAESIISMLITENGIIFVNCYGLFLRSVVY